MKHLYVNNGVVVGQATVVSGQAVPSGPAGSAEYLVDDGAPATIGWTVTVTDGVPTFTPPAASYAPLTPMQFYLAFTLTERLKIKALAAAGGVPANTPLFNNASAIPQDSMVTEFWATYELAAQLNSAIDPNLASVQGGLAHLAGETTPAIASPILIAARIPQILAGVPQ